MHALIIEDHPIIALLIEEHLRVFGCDTFDFAETAADAVAAAKAHDPDLITSDVRLPDGSGISAVQAICDGRRIPVVFITATGWEVRERIKDAVIVAKPFAPADLHEALAAAGIVRIPGPKPQPK